MDKSHITTLQDDYEMRKKELYCFLNVRWIVNESNSG